MDLRRSSGSGKFCPALLRGGASSGPTGIFNTAGEEIGPAVHAAAEAVGLPDWFVLGCAIAESGLNRYAERYDGITPTGKAAIAAQDWGAFQRVIDASSEDISFSYGQQTVQLFERRPYTVDKVLRVRSMLFDDPVAALQDCAQRMAGQINVAMAHMDVVNAYLGGDGFLGALAGYNSGSYWYSDPAGYFSRYAGNISNYRGALRRAKEMLGVA